MVGFSNKCSTSRRSSRDNSMVPFLIQVSNMVWVISLVILVMEVEQATIRVLGDRVTLTLAMEVVAAGIAGTGIAVGAEVVAEIRQVMGFSNTWVAVFQWLRSSTTARVLRMFRHSANRVQQLSLKLN